MVFTQNKFSVGFNLKNPFFIPVWFRFQVMDFMDTRNDKLLEKDSVYENVSITIFLDCKDIRSKIFFKNRIIM